LRVRGTNVAILPTLPLHQMSLPKFSVETPSDAIPKYLIPLLWIFLKPRLLSISAKGFDDHTPPLRAKLKSMLPTVEAARGGKCVHKGSGASWLRVDFWYFLDKYNVI
jgi:hypothetical protein